LIESSLLEILDRAVKKALRLSTLVLLYLYHGKNEMKRHGSKHTEEPTPTDMVTTRDEEVLK
jgi:hypothetical protein